MIGNNIQYLSHKIHLTILLFKYILIKGGCEMSNQSKRVVAGVVAIILFLLLFFDATKRSSEIGVIEGLTGCILLAGGFTLIMARRDEDWID